MSQKHSSILAVIFVLVVCGCAAPRKIIAPAPSQLPGVIPAMKTAGFWTSRLPDPDQLLMDASQVAAFNKHVQKDLRLTTDVAGYWESVAGKALREELEQQLKTLRKKTLYFGDGQKVGEAYWEVVRAQMNLSGIPSTVPVRFGLITAYADQRLSPAGDNLNAEPGDIDFDELQNSALDIGTPVVVLHQSRNGEWLYVRAAASSGWVKRDRIALCVRQLVKDWESSEPLVVTLEPKTDLFADAARRDHVGYVQMGTIFPLLERTAEGDFKVQYPRRAADGSLVMREGFIRADDARVGFLPLTRRHVIEQAFKLLNAPYGWGGMYGEQDCSRFLQEVFAAVGIRLPRNSASQIKVSPPLADFKENAGGDEKLAVLRSRALAGTTLLYMKGHIMLYLGDIDGQPYAIHAPWAFRQMEGTTEVTRVINKVVVSDLHLGQGSKRGSLLGRLKTIADVSHYGR